MASGRSVNLREWVSNKVSWWFPANHSSPLLCMKKQVGKLFSGMESSIARVEEL